MKVTQQYTGYIMIPMVQAAAGRNGAVHIYENFIDIFLSVFYVLCVISECLLLFICYNICFL